MEPKRPLKTHVVLLKTRLYHVHGINLLKILNSKKVMMAVSKFLRGPPPIVSYTYTKTIAGKIFNNRKVVNELILNCGTAGVVCSCNSSGINMSHVDMLLQVIVV